MQCFESLTISCQLKLKRYLFLFFVFFFVRKPIELKWRFTKWTRPRMPYLSVSSFNSSEVLNWALVCVREREREDTGAWGVEISKKPPVLFATRNLTHFFFFFFFFHAWKCFRLSVGTSQVTSWVLYWTFFF